MVKYALIYGYMGLTQKIDDQRVPMGYLECLQDENIIGKFELKPLFDEDRLQSCKDDLKEKGFREFPQRIEKFLLSLIPKVDYAAERQRLEDKGLSDKKIEQEMEIIRLTDENIAPDLEVIFAIAEVKKIERLLEKAAPIKERYDLNVKIYTPL